MGLILFLLFFIIAGFAVYIILRRQTIPIGSVGLVLFLNSRTRRVFNEGFCAVPFGCRIDILEVKDHVVVLPAEDVGCGDGFKIVMKGAIVRYRLRQLIPIGSGKRFRTSFLSLVRRVIPYNMDSRTAEFLSMQDAVHALVPVKAQQAVNTFCATKRHSEILGYDVIGFVDEIIKAGEVPAHAPDENVMKNRLALQEFVITALTNELESTGLEIVSFTINDYDPDEQAKAHIVDAQEKIREIQVRRLQTSAEVTRALQIAAAELKLATEHPGASILPFYRSMRDLDNNQIGAEKLGVIGQIFLAFLAKLNSAPNSMIPAPATPPPPASSQPITV